MAAQGDLFLLDESLYLRCSPEPSDIHLDIFSDPLFAIPADPNFEILDAVLSDDQATSQLDGLSLEPVEELAPPVHLGSSLPRDFAPGNGCGSDMGGCIGVKDEKLLGGMAPTSVPRSNGFMQRSMSSQSLGQLSAQHQHRQVGLFRPQLSSVFELPHVFEMKGKPGLGGSSMRRVCSAGDIQRINRMQMSPSAQENQGVEDIGFRVRPYSAEERKERINRYRNKRTQRNFNKKIKYACRKTLADRRPRVRGRFAKNEETDEIPKNPNDEDDDEEVYGFEEEDGKRAMGHRRGPCLGGGAMLTAVPIGPNYQFFGF
ncbi:hypothetical protein AMTR_s00001p00265770 [Amborella trichopoda]|uniref:CCT domain-containing protein n=2 Tax=Amborella trichopoda TaxID=13333 RepID=W1NLW0_AMBTC|nr:hypothetical protein AMTR_s00001p00265770 [Amborella trichopoda]